MPELPDITVYLEALQTHVIGQRLEQIQILNSFLLRTFDPPIESLLSHRVRALQRLGKRIAIGFDGDLWMVLHLMIAGRLHWKPAGARHSGKITQAAFEFSNGTLIFTEAGSQRRASLHVVVGEDHVKKHDPGGIDVLAATLKEFTASLVRENHTVKRCLTAPHLFSGIGNSYSDEILHQAQLSPIKLTQKLAPDEIHRLYTATRTTLQSWIERLRREAAGKFPEGVTAFRPEMNVHGKFGQPCPVCGAPVQRIRYADNETNYCARCQTDGQVLADRSLSRLLKSDWPRSIDEWE